MTAALGLCLRLLLYRPVVPVMMTIVYGVAVLMLVLIDPDKRGMTAAFFAGFATLGLAAVLTARIARHSHESGVLGLPNHTRTMQRVQAWFLALFVAVPWIVVLVLGDAPLAAAAVLIFAAAFGMSLATHGPLLFIAVAILGRFGSIGDWLRLPPVQAAIAAVGALLIWHWFGLPERVARRALLAPTPFADARHELSPLDEVGAEDRARDAPPSADPLDRLVATQLQQARSWRTFPDALGIALGYSLATAWRRVARGVLGGCAILFIWQFRHGRDPAAGAYWAVIAMCCFALVGRLQGVLQAWLRTPVEQSILRLAPHWPEARAIKRAVVVSTVLAQRGSLVGWAGITLLGMLFGWISPSDAVVGATVVLATSLAFCGSVWVVLAQKRIRPWRLSTITLILVAIAGTATALSGQWTIGLLLIVAGPCVAFAHYWIAPFRMPLDVDPRALDAVA